MNTPLSDSSWIILGLIILFFIATNLGLWAAWKRRNQKDQYHWLSKFGDSIMNPLQKERNKLEELADSVAKLRAQDEKPGNNTEDSAQCLNKENEENN